MTDAPAYLLYDVVLVRDDTGLLLMTANEKWQAAVNAILGRAPPWFRDEIEMRDMPPDLRCVGTRGPWADSAVFEKLLSDLLGKGCRVGVGEGNGSVRPVILDAD